MQNYRRVAVLTIAGGLLLAGAALARTVSDAGAPELLAPVTVAQASDLDAQPVALALPTDAACRACHADQERLKELAVEEEAASLSSGPG
ncbi:MAG: hypothetical protein JW910_07330 [Anaerolineae bacterium]|nr:hypothetical protein [Anaerolineae bacterium]